jgi:hypothetical protein
MYSAYKLWSEYKSDSTESCFCDWLLFRGVLSARETMTETRQIYEGTERVDYQYADKDVDKEALKTILGRHNFINL